VEPSDLLDAYHSGDLTGDDVFIEDPAFVDPTFVDPSGGAFGSLFALVAVLVVISVIVGVAMSVRRAAKLRDAGIDPLDPTTDLQIRYMQRTAPSPETRRPTPDVPPAPAQASTPRSVEERLADLDRLHEAGTITAAERDAARARVIETI
jgi:predicted lipid-binding transport protein (Tim44 family)